MNHQSHSAKRPWSAQPFYRLGSVCSHHAVTSSQLLSLHLCGSCSPSFHSCVTATCSLAILGGISDGLSGMSHPISAWFSLEIGLNCDSTPFIPFRRPFCSTLMEKGSSRAVVMWRRTLYEVVSRAAVWDVYWSCRQVLFFKFSE